MPSDYEVPKLPILNNENYMEWLSKLKIALKARKLGEILTTWSKPEETETNRDEITKWEEADARVQEIIANTTSKSYTAILQLPTGKQMFDEIVRLNSGTWYTTLAGVVDELMGLQWGENETASELHSKLNLILQKYIAAGGNERDGKRFMFAQLKRRAPSKYKVYINEYNKRKTETGEEHDIKDFMKGIEIHEKLLKEQRGRFGSKNLPPTEALAIMGKHRKKVKDVTCFQCN